MPGHLAMRPTLAAMTLGLASCATPGRTSGLAEVDAALQAYSRALVAMDSHQLGATFAPDGALVEPTGARHVGPAAVEAYLGTFSAYRVLRNDMVALSTELDGEQARQQGTSDQRVTLPTGETVEAHVWFRARWVRVGGRWLLSELATEPRPGP